MSSIFYGKSLKFCESGFSFPVTSLCLDVPEPDSVIVSLREMGRGSLADWKTVCAIFLE
jgi:hypothetical protein